VCTDCFYNLCPYTNLFRSMMVTWRFPMRMFLTLALLMLALPGYSQDQTSFVQDGKKIALAKDTQDPSRHTGEGRVYVKEAGFSKVAPKVWEKTANAKNTML